MVQDHANYVPFFLLYDQDEEQDPLLSSFAQLKDILNSIKGKFIQTSHVNQMHHQVNSIQWVVQPLITGTKVSKGFNGHIIHPSGLEHICMSLIYLL